MLGNIFLARDVVMIDMEMFLGNGCLTFIDF